MGLNTAKSDESVMVELLKTSIDSAKTWALIQDELGALELDGDVLAVGGKTVVVTRMVKDVRVKKYLNCLGGLMEYDLRLIKQNQSLLPLF